MNNHKKVCSDRWKKKKSKSNNQKKKNKKETRWKEEH